MTVSGFDGVDKHAKPEKSLLEVLKKHSGRNSYGRITVRHQGGGNRQKYRVIDFKRNKLDVAAKVLRLEYDPNRSAFIALCEYEDGERRYILAPVGLNPGDTVVSSANADIKAGNTLPLANIPVGTVIHNIELYPGKGAQLVADHILGDVHGHMTAAVVDGDGVSDEGREDRGGTAPGLDDLLVAALVHLIDSL